MAKGIIYILTSVVSGLIKIGKTGSNNFEQRMYNLEQNGYKNVAGLKRYFAIEVDDYDEKETLLHDIFSKSQIANTELFALDVDLVVQLLSSFEGKQIYPEDATKEEVFENASVNRDKDKIPDGIYYCSRKPRGHGVLKAKMRVEKGKFIVLAGSDCLPVKEKKVPKDIEKMKVVDGVLQEDVICNSPSVAGWVVLGTHNNGWTTWSNDEGESIDIYRKK